MFDISFWIYMAVCAFVIFIFLFALIIEVNHARRDERRIRVGFFVGLGIGVFAMALPIVALVGLYILFALSGGFRAM